MNASQTETVQNNAVVAIAYTLKDDAGQILDQTETSQPLHYLHGHQNIIPGLEASLSGVAVGEKKQVRVNPEEGYGNYNPDLTFKVGRELFQGEPPKEGAMVQLGIESGETVIASVVGFQDDHVLLDGNHPLSGKVLHFEVEVVGIRQASAEELQHGHPHGPGGHHH